MKNVMVWVGIAWFDIPFGNEMNQGVEGDHSFKRTSSLAPGGRLIQCSRFVESPI
jgi:hypothetical protein